MKRYICLFYILILLFWGLRPFNFRPVNNVDWIKKENGISFQDLGVVYGPSELSNLDQTSLLGKNESISIELWLKAGSVDHRGFSNIFSLYDEKQSEIFSFSQAQSLLNIAKYQTLGKKGSTRNWRWLRNAFFKEHRRLLTITSDNAGTIVYLDGKKVIKYRKYKLMPARKLAPRWRIIIGNDLAGKKPWKGELYGLAIYNRALPPQLVSEHVEKWRNESVLSLLNEKDIIALYPMDEKKGKIIHNAVSNHYHLSIPIRFKILKKNYLKLSRNSLRLDGLSLRDMYINVLGFIPLGYLLMVNAFSFMFSRTSTWWLIFLAILGGTLISLLIEILQAFLPTRNSSLTDLIFNALGTGIGVIFALLALMVFNYKKPCS